MEWIDYRGWRAVRLANREVELVVTRDVGPRILRFGFLGGPNVFAEYERQAGGRGEAEWMIRGGHRLWIAPEAPAWSYEPDNVPYEAVEAVPGGVLTRQSPGPVTGLVKQMEIRLAEDENRVTVKHSLTNTRDVPVRCSIWAISVMAPGGQAIIPLPPRTTPAENLLPTQNWSFWGYTNLGDSRLVFGHNAVLFRQQAGRPPNKIGLKQREGWGAYQLGELLFVKSFDCIADAVYPDGDVNFECYTNEEMLEVESLGPLVSLPPGETISRTEVWRLHAGISWCEHEADVARRVRPLAGGRR